MFGGGPTELERGNDYDPERELYNRLKLGIEGAAFTGIISTAGKGVKQLADATKAGRVAQTKTGRALDWFSEKLRPRSGKNKQYFENEMFNLSLGKSGGEDTDYLSRAFKKGAKLDFAENAIVHEPVPSERATLNWLIKRKFRVGQTYALTLFKATSSKFFITQLMFKAFSKFTFCLIMMVLFYLHPVKRYNWLLRGCLHFGVVTKLFGVKNIELY